MQGKEILGAATDRSARSHAHFRRVKGNKSDLRCDLGMYSICQGHFIPANERRAWSKANENAEMCCASF